MPNSKIIISDPVKSIIDAYHLYENLSYEVGKRPQETNQLTNLFLRTTKEKKLEFIPKTTKKTKVNNFITAFKHRVNKKIDPLNFEENIGQISLLFSNIHAATEDDFEEAIKLIKEESNSKKQINRPNRITPQEMREAIDSLSLYLQRQKEHVENSRIQKNKSIESLKKISIHSEVSKKTVEISTEFFKKPQDFRDTVIKDALTKAKKAFLKEFSSEEIQIIASFLHSYTETPVVLSSLEKGDSAPLQLAMLKALSFAQDKQINKLNNILANFAITQNPLDDIADFEEATNSGNPLVLKNFGMVFGDSFIRESGLEKENSKTEYVDIVAKFLKGKGHKIIGSEAVRHTLTNRISLDDPINAKNLRKLIKQTLDNSIQIPKKCILVGGWKNNGLIYEIERQKNGKMTFRIYNEGKGVEYHDSVQDKYKTKYSGCIALKDIPSKLMFRRSFLSTLQNISKLDEQGSLDVKPIEFLVGHVLPMLGGVKETVSDRVQHYLSPALSGTGSYRSTLAFLAHSMPPEEYKQFKFEFKMYLLDQYYPQLKRQAKLEVNAENYESATLLLSTVSRSIEKFSGGIYKLKESLFPQKFEGAQAKILHYQHQLSLLEQSIIKYEKSIHSNENISQSLSTWKYATVPARVEFKSKDILSDINTIGNLDREARINEWCQIARDNINKIPNDVNAADYSSSIETCVAELSQLFPNPSLSEKHKLILANEFIRKLGTVQAWDKVKFQNPIASQAQLNTLVNTFGNFIGELPNVERKAELVCTFFTFCYALEKATWQIPEKLRVLSPSYQSMLTYEVCQKLMSWSRTSDPFWVNYIQNLNELNVSSNPDKKILPLLKGNVDEALIEDSVAHEIWAWWETIPEHKPFKELMKESIQQDRVLQGIEIEKVKVRIDERKNEILQEINRLCATIMGQPKPDPDPWSAYMRTLSYYEGLKAQVANLRTELDLLPTRERQLIDEIERNPQYWPKGFERAAVENDAKQSSYKGSFLFAMQPHFIRSKFTPLLLDEILKKYPLAERDSITTEFEKIIKNGDLLPEEFRMFCNCAMQCQFLERKKLPSENLKFQFLAARNKETHSTLPLNIQYDKQTYHLGPYLKIEDEDPYHFGIVDPSNKSLYKDVIAQNTFSETHEPLKAQQLINKSTCKLPHDKIREIYSLRTENNIKIDALLSYYHENITDLNNSDWFVLFHSFLFDSNLLLKELENPRSAEILVPKLQKFFNRAIDNAMTFENYELAANLFWAATNVQKYLDFNEEKNKIKFEPIIDKTKIFAIIDSATLPKYEKQWPIVYESALASCLYLLEVPLNIDKLDDEFTNKVLGYAWTSHIMCRQTQVSNDLKPRKEDADRFVLFMNKFLAEVPQRYLNEELPKILNNSVAIHLAKLYSSLNISSFKHTFQDVFKTDNGTEISLINGELIPEDVNLLRVFNKPLPDWTKQYLAKNKFYNTPEDIKNLRCYIEKGVVYISDTKKNIELQLSRHGDNQKIKLLAKLPFGEKGKQYIFNTLEDKKQYMSSNYELLESFQHFSEGDKTYLCEFGTYKPTYVIQKDGIFKVDSKGNPIKSSTLISLPEKETFFSKFEDPKNTLCWGESTLQHIEFPRLKMSFRNNDGKWEFVQQEGWTLAKKQFVPHFGRDSGFLVLKNESGKKKVLLPVWPTKEIKERSLNFPYEYNLSGEHQREGHYVECTLKDNRLIPNSQEARYYLAGLYLEKGRLDQAEKLLFALEAESSNKELKSEEKKQLKAIITKKSGDIGSRTLLMQVRALYLLEKNNAQFPSESTQVDQQLDGSIVKLMKDYTKRLAHLKPLNPQDELWILKNIQKRLELPSELKARLLHLTPVIEEFDDNVNSLKNKKINEVPYLNAFKKLQSGDFVAERDYSFTTWLRYTISRWSNTFPFDTNNPQKDFEKYRMLFRNEAQRVSSHYNSSTNTWQKARKNGLLQAMYSMILSSSDEQFKKSITRYLSQFDNPIEVKTTTVNNKKKRVLSGPIEKLQKNSFKGLPGLQDLIVVTQLKATSDENSYLKNTAAEYLNAVSEKHKNGINPEFLFDPDSPELIDETSKQEFANCRDDLLAAQQRPAEIGYTFKNFDDVKILQKKLTEKISLESQVLANHETIILGAVHSALRSTPLSDLSFISRKRSLPSIQELSILCAKKDADSIMHKLYPEITNEGIQSLKESIKQYLIEKQFLQHLQRSLVQCNDILQDNSKDADVRKTLLDSLGRSLNADRAYDLNNPRTMVFLVLETMLNIKFREDQVKNIEKYADGISVGKEVVLQMIMGAGKTSVLQPILGFLLADPSNLSTVIVPEALFEPVNDGLSQALGEAYDKLVFTPPYSRQLAKDPNYLENFLSVLNEAKDKGGVLLLTPRQKHSIITSFYEVHTEILKNQINDTTLKREKLISEISHLLQIHEVDQIDEIDLVMNSQVTFKYPIGEKFNVNPQRAAFLTDLMLSLSTDKDFSDKVSLDFIQALNARKGIPANSSADSITPDNFKDVVQPLLAEKAIELLKTKIPVFQRYFSGPATEESKKEAHQFLTHFLKGTTPFDEQIQELYLPAEEAKVYLKLKKLSKENLERISKQNILTSEQLIANKIIFQQDTLNWIETNILDEKDRDILGVTAIAINQIFTKSLFKECGVHYGTDPLKGAYISRPYNAPKSPKKTMYKSPYEQVIYSIQQHIYYGLPLDASEKILVKYLKSAQAETHLNNVTLQETSSYQTLAKILGKDIDKFSLLDIPPHEDFIKLFQKKGSSDSQILTEFLNEHTFSQISMYQQNLSSSPQTSVGSSRLAGGYTGTLHEGVLSRTMEASPEIGTDGRTISSVQSKMLSKQAITEVFVPKNGKTHPSLMIDKFKADPNLYVYIDSGGWLKEENIHAYAAEMLTESRKTRPELEGIIYHNEKGAKISLEIDPTTGELITVPLAHSRLQSDLGKRLTIIGQLYETGTNIPQKPNAKAFMTVRKNMTKRDALQSIFRMRQILYGQSVSFALTEEVANHIKSRISEGLLLNATIKPLFNKGTKLTYKEAETAIDKLTYDEALKTVLKQTFRELLNSKNLDKFKNSTRTRDITLEFSKLFKNNYTIDSNTIWRYYAVNQAHAEQEKNWLAAKQKMKEVIEKPIRMALHDPKISPEDRRKLFSEFADLLIDTSVDTPYKSFIGQGHYVEANIAINFEVEHFLKYLKRIQRSQSIPENISQVILQNINTLYKKPGESKDLYSIVTDVLKKCAKKEDIPELILLGEASQEQEMEQESEVEVEVEQEIEIEEPIEVEKKPEALLEKPYQPLTQKQFESPKGPVIDIEAFFVERSPVIEPFNRIISPSIMEFAKDADVLEYSKNLIIDGAKLGSHEHGQYHLSGRYLMVVSNPGSKRPIRYVLIGHEDAGKIKEGILHPSANIRPPQAVSVISFDGSVSISTNPVIAKELTQNDQFKRVAVISKISTGKINYTRDEIALIKKMILATNNPLKTTLEIEKLIISMLKYLPEAASHYPRSALKKLFLDLQVDKINQ